MGALRRHRSALATAVVVAAVAGTITGFALTAHGYPARHVDLNDGGIWVTSNKDGLYGRLNKPAGALDLALNPPGGAQPAYQLDVRQDAAAVVSWDQASGKLYPVNVNAGTTDEAQAIPVSSTEQVQTGGNVLAVLDPSTRRVWADHIDPENGITSLAPLDPSTHQPVAQFGTAAVVRGQPQGEALTVGDDGTIYAATVTGQLAVIHPTATGFAAPIYSTFGSGLQSIQVTAVGTQVVIFDPKAGSVLLPGGATASLPAGTQSQLQAASPSGTSVTIATKTQLLDVPLSGGKPVALFDGGGGAPAAPTWLDNCVYAAWAGTPGVYAHSCGGGQAQRGDLQNAHALDHPVFRVNRGAILLNDLTTGAVYDPDTLQQVDDWSAAKPPPIEKPSKTDKGNSSGANARDLPPKAAPVVLGARPGRTTVLHVLDGDSDPQGYILAVDHVSAPSNPQAGLSIAPDGQTVEIHMPATTTPVGFSYTIDDGKGLSASSTVTVQPRPDALNQTPRPRAGFSQPTYGVAAGGTLDVPVLGDWRDFDGDPIVLNSARVLSGGGTVGTTPAGGLVYTAPAPSTEVHATLAYSVTDNIGPPVQQKVPVTVLGSAATTSLAAAAEPDTARGQTGQPIVIDPLANDRPGVDPGDPSAVLALAGTIASPTGTTVTTDLKSGTVSLVAQRKGTYLLSYTDSFGNAPFARGTIRVDVSDPPAVPLPPVTVPVDAVLYGQTPATIDALANDYDPAGGVLVIQHAAPADTKAQLQVAIVSGRWLRVTALAPQLTQGTQVIDYTVTDGITAPVTGEVVVTQLPPVADTPVAVTDYATVRAGDSTQIPVLTNDIDPDGAQLSLLDDVSGAPKPGQLSVLRSDGTAIGAGSAYVAGNQVRYVAPLTATTPQTVQLSYVVRNPSGAQATGTAVVTINPAPTVTNPDQTPSPQPLTARVVAGDAITLTVPTTAIDPDGDTATVTGLTSAPTIGRVTGLGATSISYEAFPTSAGTDRFSYQVTDRYGKTGQATVSIGVVPPGQLQPPVASDVSLTAAPGAHLQVNVLSDALISPDDTVTIVPLDQTNPDLASGVTLPRPSGPIDVVAPTSGGHPLVVVYAITDGLGSPSRATLTVRPQAGYVNPPIANDAVAKPKPKAPTVTVNVLAADSDPSGASLRVVAVDDRQATIAGASVTVPVLGHVQNIPYVIESTRGGRATAVIHVPASGAGAPQAVPNQLITIPVNGTRTIDLSDYVSDPLGKAVRLTTSDQLSAAPATGLALTSPSPTKLTLHGLHSYIGPAAITFQVTDGRSLNDPAGLESLITVPVQVGPNTPVLRCPSDPIQLVEGGKSQTVDVASVCNVWVADRAQLGAVNYTATWSRQPGGVSVTGTGSHELTLTASGSAKPGASGVLSVGVTGSKALHSRLNVQVLPQGPPSVAPIAITGFAAGRTATVNVTGYVSSPLRNPVISVVSISHVAGMAATATTNGATISITPGSASHGLITFSLVVSDVGSATRPDRQATGSVTLDVLNVPDPPGTPVPGRTTLSRSVQLSWAAPADNGAPISSYQVAWAGGSQTCAASPCLITGLTNGHGYAFTVRARNSVGYSKSSGTSARAIPDALPGGIASITPSNPQNGRLTLSWTPALDTGSALDYYGLTWSGLGRVIQVSPNLTSYTATGLDNDVITRFTIFAHNRLGAGPSTRTSGESAGAPATPTGVRVAYTGAAGSTQRTVSISWNADDPNGPGPTVYNVTRNGAPVCSANLRATSCLDTPASAQTYTYQVTAANNDRHVSARGSAAPFEVAGTPDTVAITSVANTTNDGEVKVDYTVPNSHGTSSTISCTYNGGQACPVGSWTPPGTPGTAASQTLSNLAVNTEITVTLTDCNNQHLCGTPSSGGPALTSAPPNAPTGLSCSATKTLASCNWNAAAPINGFAVSYRVSLDGVVDRTQAGTSWSKSAGEDGKAHTVQVLSVDSRGETGGSVSAGYTDKPAPPPPPPPTTTAPNPPTVKVQMVSFSNGYSGCSQGCHLIKVTLSNFTPNHTYHATADGDHPFTGGSGNLTMTTDGSGGYTGTPGPWYGYSSISVTVDGASDTCSGAWGSPSGSCP